MYKIIFLFLLLISFSLADYDYTVFDEAVEDLDDFDVGDFEFVATYSEDNQVAIIQFPEFSLPVRLNECQTANTFFYICFTEVTWWLGDEQVDEDIRSDDLTTKMHLVFNASLSELQITTEIDKTEVFPNEDVELTITIENIGSSTATQILYEEKVQKLEIKSLTGDCRRDDDTIIFDSDVTEFQTYSCKAILTADKDGQFSTSGKFEYYNGIEELKEDTDRLTINVNEPVLAFEEEISEKRLILGEFTRLEIELNNTYTETLTIRDFTINIPENLRIENKSAILDAEISWDGEVKNDLNRDFYLDLQAIATGDAVIEYSATYLINGVENVITDDVKIKISSDLEIETQNNLPREVSFEEDTPFEFSFQNPSATTSLYNVRARVQSNSPDIENKTAIADVLGRRNILNVFDGSIAFTTPGNFEITITLTYESEFGEQFSDEITHLFTVTAPPVQVEPTQEVDEPEQVVINDTNEAVLGYDEPLNPNETFLTVGITCLIILFIIIFIVIVRNLKKRD